MTEHTVESTTLVRRKSQRCSFSLFWCQTSFAFSELLEESLTYYRHDISDTRCDLYVVVQLKEPFFDKRETQDEHWVAHFSFGLKNKRAWSKTKQREHKTGRYSNFVGKVQCPRSFGYHSCWGLSKARLASSWNRFGNWWISAISCPNLTRVFFSRRVSPSRRISEHLFHETAGHESVVLLIPFHPKDVLCDIYRCYVSLSSASQIPKWH